MRKVLAVLWCYCFKPFLLASGITVWVLVGHKIYLNSMEPPGTIHAEFHLVMPDTKGNLNTPKGAQPK